MNAQIAETGCMLLVRGDTALQGNPSVTICKGMERARLDLDCIETDSLT